MSDDAVHPWATAGEPTSRNYALGGRNEFGQVVPPKPTYNLHGIAVPRDSIGKLPLDSLCHDFHRAHGTLPSRLHVPGPKQAERARSVTVHGIGLAFLDIHYGAEALHVD